MLGEALHQNHADEHIYVRSEETLHQDDALRLVEQLQEAGMLKAAFTPPSEWNQSPEVPAKDLVTAVQRHLSKAGWERILDVMRHHNHLTPEPPWDLSRPADFLAAVELALAHREATTQDEIPTRALREILSGSPGKRILSLTRKLHRQTQTLLQTLVKPAGAGGWLLSPMALWTRLRARAMRARAQAQIESTLSEAALYAARMVGTDAERDLSLARVDRLRMQLRQQLQVYCEEQGIPLPKPFSSEEAYCLHLLTAYFVSLAEAEQAIAKRGSALARRQIALEGERAEASLNSQLLPELLDTLSEVDPLREGFLRERVRHKSALMVSGVVGALGGSLWGLVESVTDVLSGGITRYAPVVAPPLLVALATLVAQTIVSGPPLTWAMLLDFTLRALWNGTITLGVTIVIYGCWQYFSHRQPRRNASPRGTAIASARKGDETEITNHVA